jgi:RNA polymerase sigma-70 factor (ECF subfamily)
VEITESEAMMLMEDMDEKYNESNGELVLEVLSEMPEELNNLIELRFMQKLSFQEIGGILGLAEPAAKMKVYRAVEKLKEKFQQRLKERQ